MSVATLDRATVTDAVDDQRLSIPDLAIYLQMSLDKVRRQMKQNPALKGFAKKCGQMWLVRTSDLEAIREILGA